MGLPDTFIEISSPPSAPEHSDRLARRTIFSGFRSAALTTWGEAGLEKIGALLPEDARKNTVDAAVVIKEWLPEHYVLAWYEAAFEGPAQRQQKAFLEFLDRMMDHGFGRVRKFLLGFATPRLLAEKAPELWRHDHTHGMLTAKIAHQQIFLTLRKHPYTTTPLARAAIAEIYRYAMALSRAKEVTGSHSLENPDELLVRINWH